MACRKPYQGINFIIAHDGFTLYDLVAYNGKHNNANGEQNRDGSNDNFSWNCGLEGETEDAGVNALRQRQMRNMMLALMVSQGTPMVLMGNPSTPFPPPPTPPLASLAPSVQYCNKSIVVYSATQATMQKASLLDSSLIAPDLQLSGCQQCRLHNSSTYKYVSAECALNHGDI